MNIYFECNMGAAGDMLASALVDLSEDRQGTVDELNSLGLPDTKILLSDGEQCGIYGTHLEILIGGEKETPDSHHGHHHHRHGRSLADINEIIACLNISEEIKQDVRNIYGIVAEAEAKAHRKEVTQVHFHELGMLDAVADITVTAYLLRKLKAEKIICSPINVGNGTVKCEHGIIPVPAPATANILTGVPYYKSDIQTELCTPTGAALLKYFSDSFERDPKLEIVKKIGIGTGTKKLERANIIRVFCYEEESTVTELSCNIDDITGEEAAYASEKMLDEGALDCFITPIFMKKGRPAYMFTVLCKPSEEEKFAALIFKHTTTIGIRKYTPSRYTLKREFNEEGGVTVKRSEGFGTERKKAEFDEIKALADERDISVFEARELINNKQ
ncbi:MAG: nickel pincer cofactor biosynthesis protein LarC [Clostridia bacterium]|nr:nickel pincer cofactor biosynthesis protein LarC [Clostridia bacterium]